MPGEIWCVDFGLLFNKTTALELSGKFGQMIAVKTADLLHVAMMEFGFDEFITADKQQHDFAAHTGMRSIFLPP